MRKLTAAKRNEVVNKGIEVRVAPRIPKMNEKNNTVAFTQYGFSVATNKLVAVFVKRNGQPVRIGSAYSVVHA